MALRQSRSTDFFVMARACLEAGLRNEFDLAEFFDSAPTSALALPVEAPPVEATLA